MNKIAFLKNVRAHDWTVERAIIASNVNSVHVGGWIAIRVIIASNVNSVHVDGWTAARVIIASNTIFVQTRFSWCGRNYH